MRTLASRTLRDRVRFRVLFEPRDLWVGVFWTEPSEWGWRRIYVCLVPCFPLVVEW